MIIGKTGDSFTFAWKSEGNDFVLGIVKEIGRIGEVGKQIADVEALGIGDDRFRDRIQCAKSMIECMNGHV